MRSSIKLLVVAVALAGAVPALALDDDEEANRRAQQAQERKLRVWNQSNERSVRTMCQGCAAAVSNQPNDPFALLPDTGNVPVPRTKPTAAEEGELRRPVPFRRSRYHP